MQHIQIKLFAEGAQVQDASPAIAIFHRWIQRNALPGQLIDVADYAHVPMGPGVLLIGHEYNLSLDQAGGRTGVLYSRKLAWEGTAQEALRAAHAMAAQAAAMLEAEPEFAGKLRFGRDEIEVTLNDRLLYPNRPETLTAVEGDLREFASEIFGGESYTMQHNADPRLRFTVTLKRK